MPNAESNFKIVPVSDAVDSLIHHLKNDPGLRIAYQANIAMAFKDAYQEYFSPLTEDSGEVHEEIQIHHIANNAANNFLRLLCHDNTLERLD